VKRKWTTFGSIFGIVLTLDIITKRWAVATLVENPSELFGGLVPLRLAYNRGAAFGLTFGDDPRWFFIPVTILAVILLMYLLYEARERDWIRIVSVSLVVTGAVGNLLDRIFEPLGVIDFIGPIWIGFMHWPIFNVADIAISCGAVLLAISFWQEEREEARARRVEGEGAGTDAEESLDPAPEPSS